MKKLFIFVAIACIVFSLSMSAFAYEFDRGVEYPTTVSVTGQLMELEEWVESIGNPHLLLYVNNGVQRIYAMSSHFYAQGDQLVTDDGAFYYFDFDDETQLWLYRGRSARNASSPPILSDLSDGLVWTNHDMYNYDGTFYMEGDENFMLPPLVNRVMESVEVAVERIPAVIGGQAMTLSICGIACLALVIGFSLFGKRSLMFLNT